MHIPVLLQEVISALNPSPGKFIIDGTLGAGGHAREVIKRITPGGKFLGVDQDQASVSQFDACNKDLSFCNIIQGNYAKTLSFLQNQHLGKADGLLVDLGFSSEQMDGSLSGRGFSFKQEEPLIMTYSDDYSPAYEVLKNLTEGELFKTLRDLGEERFARRIAKAIKEGEEVLTTTQLVDRVLSVTPSWYHARRIHPATKTFMAIRILVNKELENLQELLTTLPEIINSKGRVAIISFHSLEDRIVKHAFRDYEKQGIFQRVNKKPLIASTEELYINPRARSAKLRVIEKI
ncbi:MAG: 16S rRNA (cytosine(1402)-N(4))-methyltransferase [Candidatus Harrisonbacteria bacterium CG10_big_fil_rev_8_21_14_0_10_38_8]|uniref:Ribosomal RNA small subunit methyltransferase H n=1 Tax=Candidatus Harrisonbacteria bacterium CG10_big_fil_rev_8_21_14_0_10_38_8 TaxID=1974582 RepID=A0A2M6WKS1_9BACT|nr:MAG: 16S rRNA (cytosine(1402)-N(4))-methyltransferase [Candidatus Harrisonbacteria bacterium CG10_big_fil_rev_8_21_14_0_10_38_8]